MHREADQLPPLPSKSTSLLTQANALAVDFHSCLPTGAFTTAARMLFLKGASDQVLLPKNIWAFPSGLE